MQALVKLQVFFKEPTRVGNVNQWSEDEAREIQNVLVSHGIIDVRQWEHIVHNVDDAHIIDTKNDDTASVMKAISKLFSL